MSDKRSGGSMLAMEAASGRMTETFNWGCRRHALGLWGWVKRREIPMLIFAFNQEPNNLKLHCGKACNWKYCFLWNKISSLSTDLILLRTIYIEQWEIKNKDVSGRSRPHHHVRVKGVLWWRAKLENLENKKKAQINSVGWQHTRVDNNKTNSCFYSTASYPTSNRTIAPPPPP